MSQTNINICHLSYFIRRDSCRPHRFYTLAQLHDQPIKISSDQSEKTNILTMFVSNIFGYVLERKTQNCPQ